MSTSPASVSLGCLVEDLRALGVAEGQTLLAHVSLSSMGLVEGGAAAVVAALREAVGTLGTIVMLTATEENSLTSRVHQRKIASMDREQLRDYLRTMPAFDPETMRCSTGAVAEALRRTRGAIRSAHPQTSFTAIGPDAHYLTADHPLECHHGEESPLGKLYKMAASVLMIGVGYKACTALHLAEYRYVPDPPTRTYHCVVTINGQRRWTHYTDVVLDDGRFTDLGEHVDDEIKPHLRYVGDAPSRLMRMRDVVDTAAEWMRKQRS